MSYISIAVLGFLEALTLRIVHRQKFPLQILTYLDMSTRFPAVYKSASLSFFPERDFSITYQLSAEVALLRLGSSWCGNDNLTEICIKICNA